MTVRLPAIRGVIDRRILMNYQVDLEAVWPDPVGTVSPATSRQAWNRRNLRHLSARTSGEAGV